MSGTAMLGAGIGAVGALGALLVWWGARARPADALDDRLAPYLSPLEPGGASAARRVPVQGVGSVRAAAWWLRDRLRALLSVDGEGLLRARLERSGTALSVPNYRAQQLLWSAVATLAAGAVVSLAAGAGRPIAVVPAVGLVVVAGVAGAVLREYQLDRQVQAREEQLVAELPAVAELLALAVGAGEGLVAALHRVARTCQGELAAQLSRAVLEIGTGVAPGVALAAVATRSPAPAIARFVEGLILALERGTPMAEVLRAQAEDARAARMRRLTESGARREIAMMVPVVFGILPVTVVFAVYPGLLALDLSGP